MMILHSKRAHLYVLEHSRVYTRDGRVEYHSAEGRLPRSFSVPIANTSFVMLGPGCSVTNEAVRLLRSEGVLLGFCGSGGTPLFSAEAAWPSIEPMDEYRDPTHLEKWISIWSDEKRRLQAARSLMTARATAIKELWRWPSGSGRWPSAPLKDLADFSRRIAATRTTQEMLAAEGELTKRLYRHACAATGVKEFTRTHASGGPVTDPNRLLDQGNYLAYGMASVVLWAYGIPSGLAVVHGKTRRGALVFDLADVVKDAVVLPLAFNVAERAAREGLTSTDFKAEVVTAFDDRKVLERLFTTFSAIVETGTRC